jgi:ABC-type phosphate transport system ATPase subunit
MVFQKPNPFPKTIFENVAYGLRVNGVKDREFIAARVEESLRRAALWDEVNDRPTGLPSVFREVSSRASALPGRWRWSPKSF